MCLYFFCTLYIVLPSGTPDTNRSRRLFAVGVSGGNGRTFRLAERFSLLQPICQTRPQSYKKNMTYASICHPFAIFFTFPSIFTHLSSFLSSLPSCSEQH